MIIKEAFPNYYFECRPAGQILWDQELGQASLNHFDELVGGGDAPKITIGHR